MCVCVSECVCVRECMSVCEWCVCVFVVVCCVGEQAQLFNDVIKLMTSLCHHDVGWENL